MTVTPVSQFSVNASAGIGKQDYPGTNFGLRNNDNHVYSVGFDFVPSDKVSLGASYGYEKYTRCRRRERPTRCRPTRWRS